MTFLKRIVGAAALGAALVFGSGAISSPAQAGYVVTLEEVGNDVVATGGGAIDLTGLNYSYDTYFGPFDPDIAAIGAAIVTGREFNYRSATAYIGFVGPMSFGSGGFFFADISSGDLVAINGYFGFLYLPDYYNSGDPLSNTSIYIGLDFATLGVTPGTYVWSWGTGPNQNFTLIIPEPTAIPEPASIALPGMALAGLLLAGTIRRIQPGG
jgi:hypothetical protein